MFTVSCSVISMGNCMQALKGLINKGPLLFSLIHVLREKYKRLKSSDKQNAAIVLDKKKDVFAVKNKSKIQMVTYKKEQQN